MRFGSVCSGIEAASVAWHPLGWKAAWFSEIEPFPSAVLAHHYPDTPNLGDMTALPERILSGEVEAPDVFCGGTPCQAFSVAGLRQSLGDARGNLSLTFCEIANAIDTVRHVRGEQPAIVFWENVPGVLSTSDNAFGCFLAQLCGGSEPLVALNGWTNAGCVSGPKRTVAWRVLDAQYFGLAQRRRRVFVVASARNDFDPAKVLFEFDGLRRDTAPSRQAGGRRCPRRYCRRSKRWPSARSQKWKRKRGTHCPRCNGPWTRGGAEIGFDRSPTLTCNHEAPIVFQPGNLSRGAGAAPSSEVFPTLKSDHGRGASDQDPHVMHPIAFHPTQDPISSMDGTTHGLGCGSSGGQASVAVAQPYTLAIRGRGDCHNLEYRQDGTANALLTPNGGRGGIGVGAVAQPMSWTTKLHNTQSNNAGKIFEERSPCLDSNSPAPALLTAMAVRRLTPVECERLQGFPDAYTNIPWRNKPESPDGPRYKALGNSWALPNVRWIGQRIASALR